MAFTITRVTATQNDLGGSGTGRNMDEDNWEDVWSGHHAYVVSGFGITLDTPLTGEVTIAAGSAWIQGHYVVVTGSEVIDINGTYGSNDWYYLWLKLTEDGAGDVNGVALEVRTDLTIPARACMLFEVRVGSGGSASHSYDRRSGPHGGVFPYDGTHLTPAGPDGKLMLGWRPLAYASASATSWDDGSSPVEDYGLSSAGASALTYRALSH